ncbi:MAG: hypothetical protein ACLU9S_24650 [Oscillospiraceae bacterium]
MEMSKASSGNIPVNLAPVNVVELSKTRSTRLEYEKKKAGTEASLPVHPHRSRSRKFWSLPTVYGSSWPGYG